VTRRKLLLVDDDPASLALVREGLAAGPYDFVEAGDGRTALVRLRDERPDLVLMDVEMPGLGGVETCRIIKANSGQGGFGFIPVILMTARAGSGKVEGLELGADDYLVKPFDIAELAARVKSMLRLKGLQDELTAKVRELEQAQATLQRQAAELTTLSRLDPLTQLFNRRYFEERFLAEFSRSKRYRSPLVLMMIDLDHFKQVNDTRGHPAGDKVLKEIAARVKHTLRDVDLVARYGGEEIIALLPETGPDEGRRAGERIRAAVSTQPVEVEGQAPLPVTCSVGLAWYPARQLEDHESLVRAADDALYRAKKGGRNRVAFHEE
jgi:diguanylate cyclase (GGDEF)-like protein